MNALLFFALPMRGWFHRALLYSRRELGERRRLEVATGQMGHLIYIALAGTVGVAHCFNCDWNRNGTRPSRDERGCNNLQFSPDYSNGRTNGRRRVILRSTSC